MPMNSAPASAKPHTFAHFIGLLDSTGQYFKARFELLTLEGKEAGIRYGIALALGAGGLFVAVLGYIFVVITAVFGIAAAWDWRHGWIVILGAAALLHLGGAVALVLLAWQRIRGRSFHGTIEELRKDHEWLTQLTKKD